MAFFRPPLYIARTEVKERVVAVIGNSVDPKTMDIRIVKSGRSVLDGTAEGIVDDRGEAIDVRLVVVTESRLQCHWRGLWRLLPGIPQLPGTGKSRAKEESRRPWGR